MVFGLGAQLPDLFSFAKGVPCRHSRAKRLFSNREPIETASQARFLDCHIFTTERRTAWTPPESKRFVLSAISTPRSPQTPQSLSESRLGELVKQSHSPLLPGTLHRICRPVSRMPHSVRYAKIRFTVSTQSPKLSATNLTVICAYSRADMRRISDPVEIS